MVKLPESVILTLQECTTEQELQNKIAQLLFAADDDAWKKTVETIKKAFGLEDPPEKDTRLRILDGLQYCQTMFPNVDVAGLQAEALLQQSAHLLERAKAESEEWDKLAVERHNIAAQFQEFLLQDDILLQAITSGFLTRQYEQAKEEHEAQCAANTHLDSSKGHMTTWRGFFSDEGLATDLLDTALTAVAGTYSQTEQGSEIREPSRNVTRRITYNGHDREETMSGTAGDILGKLTVRRTQRQSQILQETAAAQESALEAQKILYDSRGGQLQQQKEWRLAELAQKVLQVITAREIAKVKARVMILERGALNYPARMHRLQERFDADFAAALCRLPAIATAITTVFGWEIPLPKPSERTSYLNGLLVWTRGIQQLLAVAEVTDQYYDLPLSVRSLIGDDQWSHGWSVTSGVLTGTWTVPIPRDVFPQHAYIRLRGISAHTKDDPQRLLWRCIIQPPAEAERVHADPTMSTKQSQLLPAVTLTRVEPRSEHRLPELYGASALHNAAPAGTWKVIIKPVEPCTTPPHAMDLYVCLSLASQGSRSPVDEIH